MRELPEEFQNILIMRTDRMGDVLLTTPAIAALRDAFPQASLSLLVRPQTRDLVADHPALHEVLVDDRTQTHRGIMGFWKLVRQLRSKQFDLAIVFHTKRRTNALAFLADIPYRLGYRNAKWGFLLTHGLKDHRHLGEKHERDYCLDVLKPLGIQTENHSLYISIQAVSEEWAEAWLKEEFLTIQDKIISVHPGASDPTKMWPPQYFAAVMNKLSDHLAYPMVLVGEKALQPVAAEILSQTRGRVIDLTGRTSVSQLVSLIKRSHLLISNDSGPVHVAEALGTPVVAIFTRNEPGINPERWQPLGEKARVVVAPYAGQRSFASGKIKVPAFLNSISPDEVLHAVDSLLGLC